MIYRPKVLSIMRSSEISGRIVVYLRKRRYDSRPDHRFAAFSGLGSQQSVPGPERLLSVYCIRPIQVLSLNSRTVT